MTTARPERFGATFRIGHRNEFRAVYAAKARVERGPLTVHAMPNESGRMRLGLSIPGRVGTAVRRNRLKRLLREAFRTARGELPGSYDVVVSARGHDELSLEGYRGHLVAAIEDLHRLWTKRANKRDDPGSPPQR